MTTRDRPSDWGRDEAQITPKPNFGQYEYFCDDGLTRLLLICPTGIPGRWSQSILALPPIPTAHHLDGMARRGADKAGYFD